MQARKALADRQKDLEVKTQQLEIKLSNKHEEDIKKARRKSTQAGQDQNRPMVWAVVQLKTPHTFEPGRCFNGFLLLQLLNIGFIKDIGDCRNACKRDKLASY